jgi:hypothetical protein
VRKALLIQITIYDEVTGAVAEQQMHVYDGSYGYEVRDIFYRLGEQVAPKVDPYDK